MSCDACGNPVVEQSATIAQTKTTIDVCADCSRHITDLTYQTGVCTVGAGEFDLESWCSRNPGSAPAGASDEFKAAVNIYG